MARGEILMRFCAFCREPAGKYRRDQYEHARDKHGAKALTKAKALELYPEATTPSDLAKYMSNETVWVFDVPLFDAEHHELDAKATVIYGEQDLFMVQLPPGPVSMTPVAPLSPFKPPERPLDGLGAPAGPRPEQSRNTGLVALQQKLLELQAALRKADALVSQILEGS